MFLTDCPQIIFLSFFNLKVSARHMTIRITFANASNAANQNGVAALNQLTSFDSDKMPPRKGGGNNKRQECRPYPE